MERKAKEMATSSRASSEAAPHRLQLVLSEASLSRLNKLKEVTEAASYGEVVRRAMQNYEEVSKLFQICSESPSDVAANSTTGDEGPLSIRVQVIISQRTLDRMEMMRESGEQTLSYAEVIRRALSLYEKVCEQRLRREPLHLQGSKGPIYLDPQLILAA